VDNFAKPRMTMEELNRPVAPEVYEKVAARMERVYPPRLPRKISVNAFVQKDYYLQEEETVRTKALGQYLTRTDSFTDEASVPEFMKPPGLSAARIGIAVHIALSKLDFSKDIPEQLDTMARDGHFSLEERNAITVEWLESFAHSDLCRRMLLSQTVLREHSFVVRYFKHNPMLLQGVVDLAFIEDGGWVICDYKSDRAPDAETLKERYGKQLKLYAEGLARVTKKPVREVWLFALRTGEPIPLG